MTKRVLHQSTEDHTSLSFELSELRNIWLKGEVSSKEINKHVNDHWTGEDGKITYKGTKLWDILMKVQDKIDDRKEKEEKKHSADNQDAYDDEDDLTIIWKDYEYSCAFIQSVDCSMYYDLKNDEILGPFSLLGCGMSKKKLKVDPSSLPRGKRRILEDAIKMNKFREKSDRYICWYSK